MASSTLSASCSPEKISPASSCSISLGSAHEDLGVAIPSLGSQQDLACTQTTRVSPRLSPKQHSPNHINSSIGVKKSIPPTSPNHGSNYSLDIDGDTRLNFNPREPMNQWKKLSSCEEFVGTKRSKHTIVAWNDRIYVFGGDNGRRMLNDFLVSHTHDSSWARVVYTGE